MEEIALFELFCKVEAIEYVLKNGPFQREYEAKYKELLDAEVDKIAAELRFRMALGELGLSANSDQDGKNA